MVHRRRFPVQSPVARLPGAVEEGQDLRLPAVPVGDAVEVGVVGDLAIRSGAAESPRIPADRRR
jgi:hypothetical protein